MGRVGGAERRGMIDGHSRGGRTTKKRKCMRKRRERQREKKQTRQPARPTARPTALPPLPFLRGVCAPFLLYLYTYGVAERERVDDEGEREKGRDRASRMRGDDGWV